jgi:hypothetical protein
MSIKNKNCYDFEKLKEMLDEINQLKSNKKFAIKLKDVIFENNPDLEYSVNSEGILLYFHDLSSNTYKNIDKLLQKYRKKNHTNHGISAEL